MSTPSENFQPTKSEKPDNREAVNARWLADLKLSDLSLAKLAREVTTLLACESVLVMYTEKKDDKKKADKTISDRASDQLSLLYPGDKNKAFRQKCLDAFAKFAKGKPKVIKDIESQFLAESKISPKLAEVKRLERIMEYVNAAVVNENPDDQDIAKTLNLSDKVLTLTRSQLADKAAYSEFPEAKDGVSAENKKRVERAQALVRKRSLDGELSTGDQKELDALRRDKRLGKLYK